MTHNLTERSIFNEEKVQVYELLIIELLVIDSKRFYLSFCLFFCSDGENCKCLTPRGCFMGGSK